MPVLSSPRHERFCQEYVIDDNGTRAYKAAGFKVRSDGSAAAAATRLLKAVKIRARILEIEVTKRRAVEEAIHVDKTWVVNKLVKNVDYAMQPVTYEGNVANRGLELLGKNLGMFQDKSTLAGMLDGAQVNVSVYLPEKARHSVVIGDIDASGNGAGPHTTPAD
jgi:phage terminase small subunit